MPTGYTYPVVEGKVTEFKDFALQCARAFGACIEMRDEHQDVPIPDEFKPDDYHTQRYEESKAEMVRLMSLTPAECEAERDAEFEQVQKSHEKYVQTRQAENNRIKAMLLQVHAWEPPSRDHIELKKFMVDQLESSIVKVHFDGPTKVGVEDWLHGKVASANRSMGYHQKRVASEVERIQQRNLWVKQLRESLEPVSA